MTKELEAALPFQLLLGPEEDDLTSGFVTAKETAISVEDEQRIGHRLHDSLVGAKGQVSMVLDVAVFADRARSRSPLDIALCVSLHVFQNTPNFQRRPLLSLSRLTTM